MAFDRTRTARGALAGGVAAAVWAAGATYRRYVTRMRLLLSEDDG